MILVGNVRAGGQDLARHLMSSDNERVTLHSVNGLLGHSQPSTTARYAHLAADPLREAAELVGQRLLASTND